LLLLQTHYRKILEINSEVMEQAREGVKRLDAMLRKARGAGITLTTSERDSEAVERFRGAMEHDFGTPEAMATVFDLVRHANGAIDSGASDATALVSTAVELSNALGLALGESDESGDDSAAIEAKVAARVVAKANKDFESADQIRDELASMGITVEDTATGPIWHRN
jgi:cysteinyl-tRNA synthetase